MGCSHAGGCPLFPLLRASLQGWRDYYCDSDDRWHDCARYQLSLTGELVPISLLPNGREAGHLRREADAYWSTADQRSTSRQLTPWNGPWSPEAAPGFEPAPLPAAAPGISRPRPRPVPSPQQFHHPVPDQQVQQIEPKRGWWTRLVSWMKGPA